MGDDVSEECQATGLEQPWHRPLGEAEPQYKFGAGATRLGCHQSLQNPNRSPRQSSQVTASRLLTSNKVL